MANGLGYTPGTGATIATLDRNIQDATSRHIQVVNNYEIPWEFESTFTVNTAIYAAGNNLGGLITISNIARQAGESVRVDTVVITDQHQQKSALEVWFFNDSITAPTDHAAWDISDADLVKVRGIVDVAATDYRDAADNSAMTLWDIDLEIHDLVSDDLYAGIMIRGTPDYSVNTDFKIIIGGVTL